MERLGQLRIVVERLEQLGGQFDLGRFQDNMAYPPSIVVKDYFSENSPGYLFVSGTSEKRYRTIIQIVPPGPGK